MTTTLSGPVLPPRSGGKPKQLVVILHGWGADGANLIDIANPFSELLPDAYFIAPNGPQPCEINPYGYEWFPLTDRTTSVLVAGARRAEKILNAFLDGTLEELGLTDDRLALVGFSQGTMLALHAALRRPKPMACLVGYSGTLLGADTLAEEITAKPPVCLIHGQHDDVVPYAAMNAAKGVLAGVGVSIESHTRPMLGHSIDLEGIQIAGKFLSKHLR